MVVQHIGVRHGGEEPHFLHRWLPVQSQKQYFLGSCQTVCCAHRLMGCVTGEQKSARFYVVSLTGSCRPPFLPPVCHTHCFYIHLLQLQETGCCRCALWVTIVPSVKLLALRTAQFQACRACCPSFPPFLTFRAYSTPSDKRCISDTEPYDPFPTTWF